MKTVDKWEEFREKKLAEMKQHKINVERRMQTSQNNIDGQMYWSQRADKLKRYPKHEALHPSWYTENIYSNNSVDLETDDYIRGDSYDASNCYDREVFHRKRMHIDTGYGGYPKSRSCCFGSGYQERPKPMLMPKSSSFTGYSSSRGMSNIRTVYSTVEEEENLVDVHQRNHRNNNNINRSGLRKLYCWENDRQHNSDRDDLYSTNLHLPHIEDDCYVKNAEIYQIERSNHGLNRNYYNKKPSIDPIHEVHATTNANYIRNIWHNRHRSSSLYKVHNINEINGNYLEECGNGMAYEKGQRGELDPHHPFEEEYLIIQNNNPSNCNVFSARNSFDDPGSVSRRQSQSHSYHNEIYVNEMDSYDEKFGYLNRDNRNKNSLDRTLGYSANASHHQYHRSKSMLEVVPPNRFDDTSSDSTIDDLYDFNFDFANQIDLDYRNNNSNRLSGKVDMIGEKNINENNYSNKYRNVSDDTDNDVNDDDFDNNSHSDGDHNGLTSPTHRPRYPSSENEYLLPNRNSHHDRYYDNCLSPSEFYPGVGNNSNQQMSSPNGNTAAATATIGKGHHHITNDMDLPDNSQIYNNDNNNTNALDDDNANMNGAISLINNIFSIYKPRKYSPISSCRTATASANPKLGSITKCMNVPSTVRPLGAPCNDFLTSMKRPLTITSSCFTTQKRNWIIPSPASVDQAQFKIIPEKTGLKISPLYRFGYEDDSKLRLKCTARPLLFPL